MSGSCRTRVLTGSGSFQNQVTDKLRVSAKVNYVKRQSDNLPATGYNNSSIPYFMILTNPSVDVRWYQQRWVKGKEGREILRPFSPWLDNPYVIAYECLNPMEKHGVVATGSIIYEFSPKWELMIRSGITSCCNRNRLVLTIKLYISRQCGSTSFCIASITHSGVSVYIYSVINTFSFRNARYRSH